MRGLARIHWTWLAVVLSGCAADHSMRAVDSYNRQGIAALAQNDALAAQRHFEQALQRKPHDPNSLYNLATALHHQGRHEAAEQCYNECLALDSAHAAARHGRAVLLMTLGRDREVVDQTERWLARSPQSAAAHAEMGWLLRQRGNLPAAQAHLQRAVELDSRNVRALVELGHLYETYRFPDRARVLYRQALDIDPAQTEAHARLTALTRQG